MNRTISLFVFSLILFGLLALGANQRTRHAALIPGAQASAAPAHDPFDRARTKHCTLGSAKGIYGFALVGSVAGVGPISVSGTTNFDGQGGDTGAFTVTTNDSVQQFTFTGSYTANDNCTGAATLNITPPVLGRSVLHFSAVGTNDEKEIKWLITDPGVILAGTLTKQ